MRPTVTAVVLNFDTTDDTVACVRSLQKVDYEGLRIVVVDNASPGGAEERLRNELAGVEVRGTGRNLGYTGGINAGFRYAMERPSDYLLVINPDTEVDSGFLAPLVEAMESDPGAAIAGGTIYALHDRTRVWYAGGRLVPWRGLAVHQHMGEVLPVSALGPPRPVSFVTGCLTLHRASLLSRVGEQDERFFLYLDDIELSARVLRRGFRLLYVPRAVVYHRVLGASESRLKLYYSVRNRLLLIDTAFEGTVRHVARFYFLAAIASKLAVWSVARRPFFEAARAGLEDYRRGVFHEGRGLGFRREEPVSGGATSGAAGATVRPVVHAVTINWNKYEDTVACVLSLQKSEYPIARILVLDNGSPDGSGDRLERDLQAPGVLVRRNRENEGFARGTNACLREAMAGGADLVFAVNNDAEVDPRCVGRLVEALLADPEAGVAGPAIFFHAQPDKVWQGGGSFSRWRAGLSVPLKGRRASELPERNVRVSFLTWCAVLVARRTLDRVGYLDPAYYFYAEDVDYGLRVREAGMPMVFVPGARVWHKIGDVARDRTSPFVLYHIGRSWTLLFRKRFAFPYAWYGIALQYVLYTPHRLWQMWRGEASSASLRAWFQGLRDGSGQREPRWRSPE